jgi:Uma2 family endonuclease
MAVDVERHRFTLEQYERMVETGVLSEDDRVELIEGEIVSMPPPSPEHSYAVQRLAQLLIRALGDDAFVRTQDPLRLPPASAPEPDLAVARPPHRQYAHRHPEGPDLLLVIEVAFSSQAYDRGRKIPLYARQLIPEVWVVDVPAETIEVYRDPTPDGYQHLEVIERGGNISPASFPDVRIPIDDFLPG